MFSSNYIDKNIVYQPFIKELPNPELNLVIVIPSFKEPDVISTLESLWKCQSPDIYAEVIVLINEPEGSPHDVSELNRSTYDELIQWKQGNDCSQIRLFPILAPPFKKKFAGAGMARKAGMDEAVRRFTMIDKPKGIIVSLDADTLLEENYLIAIDNYFNRHTKRAAATIHFSHQKKNLNEKQKKGIILYEKFLLYYRLGLEYIGYPYPIQTIGSAFAVRAGAYIKQGGMNRRTAGEDFYFLHKLTALGEIGEINQTCVYPSARVSDRVPFGTGAAMSKWMSGDVRIAETYNVKSYQDLKSLFDCVDSFFQAEVSVIQSIFDQMPDIVKRFLVENEFPHKLNEINANSSSLKNFRKRFFQTFDAFRIMKFLNWSHENFYPKQHIEEAYDMMLKQMDK